MTTQAGHRISSMHTDPLFYRLFQERPATLFELADLPTPAGGTYTFTAVELKQTSFSLDGLLCPSDDTADLPLIFVEAQFQRLEHFYGRWLASIFLYLYQHQVQRPWQAIVLYPDRGTEAEPGPAYAPLLQTGLLRRVYLEDLVHARPTRLGERLARLVVLDDRSAAEEARSLAVAAAQVPEEEILIDLLETILVYKFPKLSREEIRAMLHLPDTDLKQTRFYQEAFSEGLAEGREEGREEGQLKMLLRALAHRFGSQDATLIARIRGLSSDEQGALLEALFEFQNDADLHAWLDARQPR